MKTYVDSSVVLRLAFGEPNPLPRWRAIEQFVTSVLLVVECFRAVDRLRFTPHSSPEEIARRYATVGKEIATLELVNVTDEIIDRAAQPFPIALKTRGARGRLHRAGPLGKLWTELP